jgi:hypothetical protein
VRFRSEIPAVPIELEQVQDEIRQAFTKLAKVDFNAMAIAMTQAFERDIGRSQPGDRGYYFGEV